MTDSIDIFAGFAAELCPAPHTMAPPPASFDLHGEMMDVKRRWVASTYYKGAVMALKEPGLTGMDAPAGRIWRAVGRLRERAGVDTASGLLEVIHGGFQPVLAYCPVDHATMYVELTFQFDRSLMKDDDDD
jgi:hypothetical protein